MTSGVDGRDQAAAPGRERARSGAGGRFRGVLADPHHTVAVGCAVLAVVVMLGGWGGLLWVVAGHVVPGWALAGVLLGVLLAQRLARRLALRRERGADAGARSVRRPWLMTLLTVVAAVGSGLDAVGDVGATYHVLTPTGPDGCRAVVREVSFLLAGRGDVYAVGASGIGRRLSSWTADDGYRPIASGTYTLRWATGGVLTVSGRSGDPVWPALHEGPCG